MDEVAKLLDTISNGFIEAWHVTLVSLLGHVVVLLALIDARLENAALLLLGFALLDALDGAIARLHKTASPQGMLLDSTTDRMKETLVFGGLAYYFADLGDPLASLYTVLALGMSISVSYVKAKGEAALAEQQSAARTKKDINREFEDGVFGYEIRTVVLIVALLIGQPLAGVGIVLGGSLLTFLTRFNAITSRLNDKD